MGNRAIEIAVGIFVIFGLICVGYLTVKLGKVNLFGDDSYLLFARFQSVSGLKPGASVEMAGVEIGKVEGISLDNETWVAVVRMKIINGVVINDDSIATVATAGLIGDKFVKISPGGSDIALKQGDTITETESSLNLEELVGKYVFGNAS